MIEHHASDTDLLYGVEGGGIVFIPARQAKELADTWAALRSARTWGEFRSRVTPERYDELLGWTGCDPGEMDDAPPRPEDPFQGLDLVADGDYPEWPAQEMLRWMPREIIEMGYGRVGTSFVSGPCLDLFPQFESEIVAILERAGYRCTRADALVCSASGY